MAYEHVTCMCALVSQLEQFVIFWSYVVVFQILDIEFTKIDSIDSNDHPTSLTTHPSKQPLGPLLENVMSDRRCPPSACHLNESCAIMFGTIKPSKYLLDVGRFLDLLAVGV